MKTSQAGRVAARAGIAETAALIELESGKARHGPRPA